MLYSIFILKHIVLATAIENTEIDALLVAN